MEFDNEYFESYDSIQVHNLMLRDEPRLDRYREAILLSQDLFKDKIVLDVGSGTGILSLFCCEAGAKHVYSIEACKGISILSKKIIEKNNLTSKITCINEIMEKVKLPVDEVDIIVSEWMGVYLLHESMLNSVIYARDKYLRKDGLGLMYPSIAYLYICPIQANNYINEQLNYWDKFYHYNFEPMKRVYCELMKEKPIVEKISQDQLVSDEKILASLDLNKITKEDLSLLQSYNLKFSINKDCELHGFAFWFDVIFHTDSSIVTLSTSPRTRQTHWKQTVVLLPNVLSASDEDPLRLSENDEFECFALLNQCNTNIRHYVIDVGISNINRINSVSNKNEDSLMNNENDEEEEESDSEEHPMPCDCGSLRCLLIKKTLEKYEENDDSKTQDDDE